MRSSYLKEVSDGRDRSRSRFDPEKGRGDVIMTFDVNPDLVQNCNLDQVTALKALVENSQLTDLREELKKKAQQVSVLEYKLAVSEKDLKKAGREEGGASQEVVMALESEIERLKVRSLDLHRKVEEEKEKK